ncbi:hypothetical protein MES5069_680084 [Mesorhizobium escarrei]|uniref:Uncharacterized protein n=1 Tax=Mesorhizobium escarrei TaxID=666018 RepID=A0ABM9EGE8_9HYPH|nr:hypothetical protein MES5069_680084 [Mesorhizobium escarrei]
MRGKQHNQPYQRSSHDCSGINGFERQELSDNYVFATCGRLNLIDICVRAGQRTTCRPFRWDALFCRP